MDRRGGGAAGQPAWPCSRDARSRPRPAHRPADVGFTGITDARYYINRAQIPTVILGPGSLRVAHTADEWVAVDDLVTAARLPRACSSGCSAPERRAAYP